MKKYLVTIEETLVKHVIVEADDYDEAVDFVEDMCNVGTIEVTYEDFVDRYVSAEETDIPDDYYKKFSTKEVK